MECRLKMLTLACGALSLSNCTHIPPLDSFCTVYNRVVVAKGDGSITAPLAVKKRILANELIYREQCGPK